MILITWYVLPIIYIRLCTMLYVFIIRSIFLFEFESSSGLSECAPMVSGSEQLNKFEREFANCTSEYIHRRYSCDPENKFTEPEVDSWLHTEDVKTAHNILGYELLTYLLRCSIIIY